MAGVSSVVIHTVETALRSQCQTQRERVKFIVEIARKVSRYWLVDIRRTRRGVGIYAKIRNELSPRFGSP